MRYMTHFPTVSGLAVLGKISITKAVNPKLFRKFFIAKPVLKKLKSKIDRSYFKAP